MKPCDDCQILIQCYLDGESTEEGKQGAFLHLGGCKECQSFLKELLNVKVAAAREKRVDFPPRLDQRIASIAEESSVPRWFSKGLSGFVHGRIPLPVPVAAAVVIGLVAIGTFLSRPQQGKVTTVDHHTPRTQVMMSMPEIRIPQD